MASEKEKVCYDIKFYLKGKMVCEYGSVYGTDLTDALAHLRETRREKRESCIEYDEIKASFCQMTMLNGKNRKLGWYTHTI